jgi:hypothetical protein
MIQSKIHGRNNMNPEDDLEQFLFSSLSPVEPNTEFVNRLKDRFERRPTTVLEHRTFWGVYLIVASGLFVGMLSFWLALKLSGAK